MEIELKYTAEESVLEKAFDSDVLCRNELEMKRRELKMQAVYFDNDERTLVSGDISVRLRREGDMVVATSKWSGGADARGLHRRNEVNVPVKLNRTPEEIMSTVGFDPEWLRDTEIYGILRRVVGESRLKPVATTEFTRRIKNIEKDGTYIEVAFDLGQMSNIKTGHRAPICEIEMEIISGSEDVLNAIGNELQQQFRLTPEARSKYGRALKL